MEVKSQAIFNYKTNIGPLHKIPAVFKLLFLLFISVFCITLSSVWLAALIIAFIIIAFTGGITLSEQLTDFKPVFLYAVFMFILSIFSNITDFISNSSNIENNQSSLFIVLCSLLTVLFPRPELLQIILRLVVIVQLSALVFRTTSSLEIREVIRLDIFTLFICFIPEIFRIWSSVNLSWKARGGKHGLVKIKTLIFVLISLSFEKAAVKSKALESRKVLNYGKNIK